MSTQRPSLLPGLILIAIGAVLLVNKLTPYSIGWDEIYPLILILLGLLIFKTVLHKRDKGGVFIGALLFLLFAYFIVKNYDIVPYEYVREVWPIIMIILGLSFLSVFIFSPKDWGPVIPGGILLFIGTIVLLRRLDLLNLDFGEIISDYWSITLILIGGAIIFGALKK